MNETHEAKHVIIDAKDLCYVQRDLLGHPPTRYGRIDYERIENVARWSQPQASLAPLIELFDVERAGGLASNPFYQWAADERGYDVHLTERGPSERWEHEDRVILRLREPGQDCRYSIVFVCGSGHSGHVRAEVASLAQVRDVHLVCFNRCLEFEDQELERLASVRDLVEIKAVGNHHYRGRSETPTADSEPACIAVRVSASPSSDNDHFGSIGHALAKHAPALLDNPGLFDEFIRSN